MAQGIAGYNGTIKVGGTSTALTNEACGNIDAGAWAEYQITDATKQVLDPAVAVVVEADISGGGYNPVSSSLYSIDYYTSVITFDPVLDATYTIRIGSGSYIPTLAVSTCRSSDLSFERDVLDTTTCAAAQANGGWRTKIVGLGTATGSLELLEDGLVDHDPGAGTVQLLPDMISSTLLLMEIVPDGSTDTFRSWVYLSSAEQSIPLEDIFQTTFSFQSASKAPAPAFSWSAN
jgi:hypothetical protein